MKKILMGTAIAALVLTVGGTDAFAAGGRNYVDANGDVAQKYGIMSIPNVIVFKNGAPAAKSLGFVPAATLKAFFEQNL